VAGRARAASKRDLPRRANPLARGPDITGLEDAGITEPYLDLTTTSLDQIERLADLVL
jgi:hypothetical protein